MDVWQDVCVSRTSVTCTTFVHCWSSTERYVPALAELRSGRPPSSVCWLECVGNVEHACDTMRSRGTSEPGMADVDGAVDRDQNWPSTEAEDFVRQLAFAKAREVLRMWFSTVVRTLMLGRR